MDLAWVRREVKKIYVRKAAQVGVSEACRNILLHLAISEPDPAMLILPDEKTGKRVMGKRILPMFEDTEALTMLKTGADKDKTLSQVLLANGFNLQLAWSGSPATMAADPVRFVLWDETDKSKHWDGKESGVGELIDVRTATYENSLFVAMSTPTTSDGQITEMCENAQVKLWFYCPCPHCGKYQQLAFERIKYPKTVEDKGKSVVTEKPSAFARITDETWVQIASETDHKRRSALVESNRAAWYECEGCKAAILDHQKQRMLLAGYWGTDDGGYKLFYDGHEEGKWPLGSEVSFHFPAWLSLAPKHRFYKIAAEWVLCAGNERRTQGFRNSWQGEAFKIITQRTAPDNVRQKKLSAPPPRIVPEWTKLLCMSVDVQGTDPSTGYFYYVIRAWGYGYRSQLIEYGIINTFDELYIKAFEEPIPYHRDGKEFGKVVPQMMLIDSGDRTEEIYQFVMRDPSRIKPTKGASVKQDWPVNIRPQKRSGVLLWNIDTEQTKDMLNRLMHDPDPKQWAVHNQINDDYCQQLASEEKIFSKKHRRVRWEKKTSSTPNHLLDCEQMQCAAAIEAGLGQEEPKPQEQDQQQQPSESYNPITSHRGRW